MTWNTVQGRQYRIPIRTSEIVEKENSNIGESIFGTQVLLINLAWNWAFLYEYYPYFIFYEYLNPHLMLCVKDIGVKLWISID